MSVYQISVFLENRAGQLAEITKDLADHNVDLRAISIAETADYGILRLIVDDTTQASTVLQNHEYVYSMTPVVVVAVNDAVGGLAPVLELLAEVHLDIEYMYSLFTHQEGKAYMVFRTSDEKKFVEQLNAHGITPADKEDLGLK
ncbi:MAG: ACT domain-containing protein [Clostridia bacterium]|nr:ACT domain-containing protein [Clostridia bacterium]